jgi:hypothetical protein
MWQCQQCGNVNNVNNVGSHGEPSLFISVFLWFSRSSPFRNIGDVLLLARDGTKKAHPRFKRVPVPVPYPSSRGSHGKRGMTSRETRTHMEDTSSEDDAVRSRRQAASSGCRGTAPIQPEPNSGLDSSTLGSVWEPIRPRKISLGSQNNSSIRAGVQWCWRRWLHGTTAPRLHGPMAQRLHGSRHPSRVVGVTRPPAPRRRGVHSP